MTSPFGQHIVMVINVEPGRAVPLEEVRDKVHSDWIENKRNEARDRFHATLRKRYDIQIEWPGPWKDLPAKPEANPKTRPIPEVGGDAANTTRCSGSLWPAGWRGRLLRTRYAQPICRSARSSRERLTCSGRRRRQGDMRLALNVALPDACVDTAEPRTTMVDGAVIQRWRTTCQGGSSARRSASRTCPRR